MSDHVRAVERAARILKVLAEESGGMGVTEIAEKVDLGKSTTHRLLSSLSRAELVRVEPKGRRYSLGYGLLQLAAGRLNGIEVRTVALPHLRFLRDRSRETVSLHVRDGFRRVAVERLDTAHEVRFVVDLGRPLPLHQGATGKAILAFIPEEEIKACLAESELSPQKCHVLLSDLETVRRTGTAFSLGERVSGTGAVAAPVFTHDGQVVASVSVLSLESRLQPKVVKTLRQLVREAASAISRDLGWQE